MASIFSVFGEILIDNTNADKSIDSTTEKAEKSRARNLTLLHKYYDWQLIESLPLAALGGLLSFATEEEKRLEKAEQEKRLFPLWLANYALAKLQGSEAMDYETFINQTFSEVPPPAPKKEKSADDITAEFAPIIEADRRKGG